MLYCGLSIFVAATETSGDEADGNKGPKETDTGKHSEFLLHDYMHIIYKKHICRYTRR